MAAEIFIHPQALVESVEIGAGTRVWAFAHVMAGAIVGADCNIGDHAFIEGGAVVGNRVTVKNNALIWDGVSIEDDVFVGPNVVFTNDPNPRVPFKKPPEQFSKTLVMTGASLGANSTIVCGLAIGRHAMVGAGSVVTKTVANHALVVGNPARRVGWVCECGENLGRDLICSCGRRYREAKQGLERSDS